MPKSKVSDSRALSAFMSGKKSGGKRKSVYSCPKGECNPQGQTYSSTFEAEKMDRGLPLRKR